MSGKGVEEEALGFRISIIMQIFQYEGSVNTHLFLLLSLEFRSCGIIFHVLTSWTRSHTYDAIVFKIASESLVIRIRWRSIK